VGILRRKDKLVIPLQKIEEGIDLCLGNASQFCKDAKLLNSHASSQHALGLCIFAIEELGKAHLLTEQKFLANKYGNSEIVFKKDETPKLLNECYRKTAKESGFSQRLNLFYDHRCKLFLGRGLVGIAMNGRLSESLKDQTFKNFRDFLSAFEKTETYPQINVKELGFREDVMYIDFDQLNNIWVNGTEKFPVKDINDLITDIERAIIVFNKNEEFAP
jgi:AbiV family abortive infection protein